MPFYVGGTAGMRNMGTYAAGTTYFANDLVQYNGSSYIAISTSTGNLPTNVTYWSVLAAAGSGFNTVAKSGAGSANAFEVVLADAALAAFSVALPTSPVKNTQVLVKKVDVSTNVVTVTAPSIDGASSYALSTAQAAAEFIWDGTIWRVSATAGASSSSAATAAPDVMTLMGAY